MPDIDHNAWIMVCRNVKRELGMEIVVDNELAGHTGVALIADGAGDVTGMAIAGGGNGIGNGMPYALGGIMYGGIGNPAGGCGMGKPCGGGPRGIGMRKCGCMGIPAGGPGGWPYISCILEKDVGRGM